MKTAREILIHARKISIAISADGPDLVIKPKANVTPELLDDIRNAKAELLCLLAGNYTHAAKALVLRCTQPGEQREEITLVFDEHVARLHVEGGLGYGDACRAAYVELCKEIQKLPGDSSGIRPARLEAR